MQYIHSLLSIAGAFLTITGAFIAGWFVATDKNRSELFKQKLGAYKNLSGQISKVYTLGVALEKIEVANSDSVYRKEAAALLNMLLSEAIFLEEHTMKQIFKFIQMQPSEYSHNKEDINKIIGIFRNDLSLSHLNLINQLSSLKIDVKKLLGK